MSECGTYGGFQAHGRRGEDPCEPCRLARNAYARKYRSAPGPKREAVARRAEHERIRARALSELGRRHPDELERIQRAIQSGDVPWAM